MTRELGKYVMNHTVRGQCMCGRCFDAGKDPEKHQPTGHTEDLIFFKVAMAGNPTKNEFLKIIKKETPWWLDGKERDYLTLGCELGDQGLALMTMGLGSLLGIWKLLTPKVLLPGCSDAAARQLAGMGQISIYVPEEQ